MSGRGETGAQEERARRTFVAIELPDPVRRALAEVAGELRRQWPGGSVRWVRPEGTHLTLRFLGDTDPHQVEELADGLARAAAAHQPMDLSLGAVGAFPNRRRPRVIWVGVKQGGGELAALQRAIEELARDRGWKAEFQAFVPHLTLGRVKPRTRPPAEWGIEVPASSFRAGAVALMESLLKPTGAEYRQVFSAALGGPRAGPAAH